MSDVDRDDAFVLAASEEDGLGIISYTYTGLCACGFGDRRLYGTRVRG